MVKGMDPSLPGSVDEASSVSPREAVKRKMNFLMLSHRYNLRSRKLVDLLIPLFVVVLGLIFSSTARSQVAGGSLSGTITDPSGGAVSHAEIEIKNAATGVERTIRTHTDGFYSVPNLLPGEYQVTVTAEGFNKEIKIGITISVGAESTFDLTMQIGSISHVVEVTTEAPAVDLASSAISAVVNATTVRELPLNGRSWTDLATLQPGVNVIQTQPSFTTAADRGNRGFGQQLTISGARPAAKQLSSGRCEHE